MKVRQFINRNPLVMVAFVLLLVGICAWVIYSQVAAMSGALPPRSAFFTVDDGKTWFIDDVDKMPPFDKDGKQAVRLYFVQCGENPERFPAYLERFTPKGKEVTERYRAEQKARPGVPPASLGEIAALGVNAMEVKKPGEEKWTPKGQGVQIMQYKCPDGSNGVVIIRP